MSSLNFNFFPYNSLEFNLSKYLNIHFIYFDECKFQISSDPFETSETIFKIHSINL